MWTFNPGFYIKKWKIFSIESKKNSNMRHNMTQRELSQKSGVIQPTIARIEKMKTSPQTSTLIKLLYPLGYTLKVVPIKRK